MLRDARGGGYPARDKAIVVGREAGAVEARSDVVYQVVSRCVES